MPDDEYFGSNDAEQEIGRLNRTAKKQIWSTPQNRQIHLMIPPTVYPPREDTDLLARIIHSYPKPNGKRLLEIGCGSGAVSLFAAQLGFIVTSCDINPYAVASSRNAAIQNSLKITVNEGGPGPQNDGEVSQWSGNTAHDVILWNLPYLSPEKNSDLLGPMEEAALLDTDDRGLVSRLLDHVNTSKILAEGGVIFLLVSQNQRGKTARSTCIKKGFAVRSAAAHRFDDGECLEVLSIWRPFEHQSKMFHEELDSTNTSLLSSDEGEGGFLQTGIQRAGHGRRGRVWTHEKVAFAGSWVVHDRTQLPNPGLLQLQGGLALYEAIISLAGSSNAVVLKWPNDVLLRINGELRKVGGILVESISRGNNTRAVLGIGCNISSLEPQKETYSLSSLDELNAEITLSRFQHAIQCSVASWFEQKTGIPDLKNKAVLSGYDSAFSDSQKDLGNPLYRKLEMRYNGVEVDGKITLLDHRSKVHLIEDGEDINWSNYSPN